MELTKILQKVLEIGGSDLFLIPGSPATAKVKGHLVPLTENKLLPEDTAGMIKEAYGMAGGHSDEMLRCDGDDDFSFSFNRQARFRCNAYKQRGTLAATCRVVTFGLPNPDALHIPPMVIDLASSCRNGMVLVTGPAGSGKSTTLACMVDRINADQDVHIITIEDPIEYLHAHKRALVSQREIPNDACSFARALRAAMREAPDVITHFSPTTVAMLLPTVDYNTGDGVMDRIKQKFYQAYPNSNVLFNYRIAPLSANAIVEEPQKPRRGRGRAAKGTAKEKAAP